MIEAPFALAFGAGLVATMNPCGFAMLPAYLSYFMGLNEDEETTRGASLRRALMVGGVMSGAFLLVFGVTGLAITAGFRAVIDWIPWIALVVGALVAVLGVAMLFGYELTVGLPKAKRATKGSGFRSVFGFGISYGLASLSCTLPVFLSVVATQLTTQSFVSGVATFVVYGLGMSMMLVAVTIVLALGKQTLVRRLRSSVRYINRISGAVLVLAGAYIVWFWGTSLASGAGALNNSGAFRFFETLSRRATSLFGENAVLWGLILGGLIAAAAGYALAKSRGDGDDGDDGRDTDPTDPPSRRRKVVTGSVAAVVLAAGIGGFAFVAGSSDDRAMAAGNTPGPAPTPASTTGASFDGTDLIVEQDPDVPARLAALQGWTTAWGRRTIDLSELILGIFAPDPRDIIPPLDDPEFETAAAAGWLDGREPGVLIEVGDDARFFPLRILTLHEIVNGTINGAPVVVSFCPLCNTAVAFSPIVDGEVLRFGVSGLLRFSDLVMWDSSTESLWQQINGEAIVGELAGMQLELLPAALVSWDDFRSSFPGGLVLSRHTGYIRNYGTNPYVGYSSSGFPFLYDGDAVDDRFPALERVVGVTVGDTDKAFPFSVLAQARVVNDTVGDVAVVVFWGSDTADALDTADITEGRAIGTAIAFDRSVGDQALTFSANGDDTFTDLETGSTWDLLGTAAAGPLAGERLATVIHRNDFWFAWAAFHEGAPVHGD